MSLRDQILAASDIERKTVEVPEWGCMVEVRSPSGRDRAAIVALVSGDEVDNGLLYPVLLIPTLFDPESGEPIFTAEDAEALNQKSSKVLERLALIALELAAVTPEALDAGKGDS